LQKKGDFYKDRTGIDTKFTNEFGELSGKDEQTTRLGNLDGKMAVIYLDGNQFGKRQTACETPDDLKRWDQAIQDKRQAVLKGLLEKMVDEEDGRAWRRTNRELRIETLLWGGDDLLWVVPAWKGIETLKHFFAFREDPERAFWEHDGQPLTHAAGVVFCHRNAPIHRVRRLAEELAGLAKDKDKSRDQNLAAYEVLESFDNIGTDLKAHRQRWFRNDADPVGRSKELILSGDHLSGIEKVVRALKKEFPRRQLHRIVQTSLDNPEEGETIAEKVVGELEDITEDQWEELKACFGTSMARWIHLVELWDYIV
jgi:hypothetical protein